jgi:hypothetical protein
VGDLKLTYVRRDLVADPDLTIFAYTAEAGSRHQEPSVSSAAGPQPTKPDSADVSETA